MDPLIIGGVVAVIALIAGLVVLSRRRRNAAASDTPPIPEVSDQVDYTSIPYQEKLTPMERFQRASPGVKALLLLLPLAAIGLIAAIVLTLTAPPPATTDVVTPTPLVVLNIVRAEVVGNGKIVVEGTTQNLPAGSGVSAIMREGEADFAWFNADIATAAPDPLTGRVAVTLERRSDAPVPVPDRPYSVVLIATPPNGQPVRSEPAPVVVLGPFAGDFFQNAAVVLPTIAPTTGPATSGTARPTATPAPAAPAVGAVRANGNLRQAPSTGAQIIGSVVAAEQVTLLARSVDGEWYRATTQAGEGWVSATLLEVEPAVADALPREEAAAPPPATGLTGLVFNGGNLRQEPNLQGNVLDQINAGESVNLLARNAAGTWVQITNIRGVTGWVSITLLTIGPGVLEQLPGGNAVAQPPLPPPPTGFTAQVFNGGNVRQEPNLQGAVIDQINAGETVQILARTADSQWYRVINERNLTGWVNRTLLTIDPAVADRVPVA